MNSKAEMYQLLAASFHLPDPDLEELRSEQARLFSLTVAGGISPYETEYGDQEVFAKTQSLADIAGFYRAFGFEVAPEAHQRIDFIGAELEWMSWIVLKEEHARKNGRTEEAELCHEAAAKFLHDHLGRWAPFLGNLLKQEARHPFYRMLGETLQQFIDEECSRFEVTPEKVTAWKPIPVSATDFECGMEQGGC
ncbi:MAG: molecular chaperone TorD family protein [Deltaproteobacteria bacterium]|nr:molecular chaperone TorD family protein [Deltaproteobacteria bacterium]MBI2501593.1 molecular chaperone TorD family protein [Deltaproteobacteria bacterium]